MKPALTISGAISTPCERPMFCCSHAMSGIAQEVRQHLLGVVRPAFCCSDCACAAWPRALATAATRAGTSVRRMSLRSILVSLKQAQLALRQELTATPLAHAYTPPRRPSLRQGIEQVHRGEQPRRPAERAEPRVEDRLDLAADVHLRQRAVDLEPESRSRRAAARTRAARSRGRRAGSRAASDPSPARRGR